LKQYCNLAESGLELGWKLGRIWACELSFAAQRLVGEGRQSLCCFDDKRSCGRSLTDKPVARDKINSVATTATNGNGRKPLVEGVSGAQQMLALAAAFKGRGYVFKRMPQAKVAEIRWQCGRDVLEEVDMPDGQCLLLERFELLAWGASANELIERLAAHE
jgi:hypothetical protein